MRVDCYVVDRYIIINYCEELPGAGVRVREGDGQPFSYDFHFYTFQDFYDLVYYILEKNTHEGFLNEKK